MTSNEKFIKCEIHLPENVENCEIVEIAKFDFIPLLFPFGAQL